MSKVITFSRVFPKYHPKAGQPTYFVEQIYNSLFSKNNLMDYPKGLEIDDTIMGVKKHTIRNGNRWKVGDKFSPRVWSDKPYNSKQIILCEDLEVKKVFDFEIKIVEVDGGFASKGFLNDKRVSPDFLMEIAENDGLLLEDFLAWFQFPKSFKGQVICWSDAVSYGFR
jgi:hypothetical protein